MTGTGSEHPCATSHPAIQPEEYSTWRLSPLGMITERVEQETMFDLAGDLRKKRVLDLGCGDGSYSIYAARHGARVVGVDSSAAMLASAERRAKAGGVSVYWCQACAEQLPFDSASFDVVLAVTIFCLVEEPSLAAQEVSRVLCRGGSFVIGELGRYSWWALWRRLRAWSGSARWRQARFWNLSELRSLLRQAGLRAGSARGCVYYPPIALAARILDTRDRALSFLGQRGAAFLAVKGQKPFSDLPS